MLTIKEARATLPDNGKDLSDEEVEKIRDEFYQLTSIIFDTWLSERNEKKETKTQNQTSSSPEIPSQTSL